MISADLGPSSLRYSPSSSLPPTGTLKEQALKLPSDSYCVLPPAYQRSAKLLRTGQLDSVPPSLHEPEKLTRRKYPKEGGWDPERLHGGEMLNLLESPQEMNCLLGCYLSELNPTAQMRVMFCCLCLQYSSYSASSWDLQVDIFISSNWEHNIQRSFSFAVLPSLFYP